ncbi:hypothetical protein GGS21DRAFT_529374, partial [Xylaria nigripes]
MPSFERDLPSDRHVRHQHSNSSNALVPMWDSSDPDRAPPPLPLHPQSPTVTVGTSRVGTSLAIQNAHAALTEKARENALPPSLHKRNTDISPERLNQRPNPNKRMQSLQPGTVRDLSLMIEGARDSASPILRGSSEKDRTTPRGLSEKDWHTTRGSFDKGPTPKASSEKDRFPRPSTPVRGRDPEKEARPIEKDISNVPGPQQPISSNLPPGMRSSVRWPQQSILGENTPPQSATMLALHHVSPPPTRDGETPLATVTNNAAAQPKSTTTNDQLSSQLIALTNIATALHKEMTALSRRSRDNATDLMSLKEATHARDEDIRKSLRDLVTNTDPAKTHRETYNNGLYIENKPFNTSPVSKTHRNSYAIPRMPSPNSFAASLDRESVLSTPSLVGSETPATMALLEKIIREMGTKEGQDSMFDRLSELAEKISGMASATKVQELLEYLKTMKEERALVPASGNNSNAIRTLSFDTISEGSTEAMEWNQHHSDLGPKDEQIESDKESCSSRSSSRPKEILSDDILKVIHSVKDSVAQGGGLTAEVKALVRELRGEVLGMGRELGRKLEESGGRPSHSKSEASTRAELAKIVEESLEQMKLYMQQRLREHRRKSTDSDFDSESKPIIDYQEIYNAMRTAITDAHEHDGHGRQVSRDDVLNAVKDAWENYKPEIEIQQVGLERDEVLACIKEGLLEASQNAAKKGVVTAVAEGMKNFTPPKTDSLSRDEVLDAVRECLEEFEFPVAPSAMGRDLTRDDVLHAVKQALDEFDFPDLNKALVPHDGKNAEILHRLHDIMEYMQDELKLQHIMQYLQSEFKILSDDARQSIAAGEQNTEQVLDATKDGFETLRVHIEEYVDRVAENGGTAAQEELMANLVNSLDTFRDELSEMMAKTTDDSRDLVKQEIESLRDAVNSSLVPHVPPPSDNREIFEAIRESLNQVRSDLLRPHAGTTGILDALHEGFSDMRACLERITDKPVDLTANDEILDAFRSGFDDVRADIGTLRGDNGNDKALTRINRDPADLMIPTDLLKHDDIRGLEVTMHDGIKNLEVVMRQLQTRMETMNSSRAVGPLALESGMSKDDLEDSVRHGVSKDDLNQMEEMLGKAVSKEDLNEIEEMLQKAVSKEDLNKLEEMLRKAVAEEDLDETEDSSPKPFSKEDLGEIEQMLRKAISKDELSDIRDVLQKAVSKEDLTELREMLRNMQQSVAGVFARSSKDGGFPSSEVPASKEDVQAIETILRNTKCRLDDLVDGEQAVRKDHVDAVGALVLQTKDSFGALAARLETLTRKEDLSEIVLLVTEVAAALGDMKEQTEKSLEDPERVTKTDVEAIETAVSDIKTAVEKISIGDVAGLPSKEDLKSVEDVVREIKEHNTTVLPSKDDLKTVEDLVRELRDYNAAQEDATASALANRQAEVLGVNERVAEVQAFLEKFQTTAYEKLEAGGTGVETLGRILESLGKTINQTTSAGNDLKQVFQSLKAELDEYKTGLMSAKSDSDGKFQEIADSLQEKVSEKIDELVMKYDDFQLVMDDRTKAGESRDIEMEAAVVGTKTVTEEVKVLMDTLGASVTDSLEKMEEASKTVFNKVEMLYDNHVETHEEVKQVSDFQPKILEAVKDVLLVAGQHFEHSKMSMTDIQQSMDDANSRYDGVAMHSKLDLLVDHTHTASQAYAQLDTLEKVHQQVVQTAAEISEFLSSQKQRVENEYEDRERTLQETALALERQRAEQEHVMANLAMLRDEESQLRENVLALRAEQEVMARQKTRLTADVSSLETALHLRREELHAMDIRAEALERRILEGVLDHSRALLMTKSGAKGREAMSRKRVSHSSLGAGEQQTQCGANLAVKNNRASLMQPSASGTNRRILSLSLMTNNVPTGGLQRSQSVRTAAPPARKASWAPGRSGTQKGYGELDKENVDSVRESDEEEGRDHDHIGRRSTTPTSIEIPEEDDTAMYRHADYEGQDYAGEDVDSDVGTTVITDAGTDGSFSDRDPAFDRDQDHEGYHSAGELAMA